MQFSVKRRWKKVDVKNDEIKKKKKKTVAGKRYARNAQLDPVDRMDFARNARTSTCPNQPKLLDATAGPRIANLKWKTNFPTLCQEAILVRSLLPMKVNDSRGN